MAASTADVGWRSTRAAAIAPYYTGRNIGNATSRYNLGQGKKVGRRGIAGSTDHVKAVTRPVMVTRPRNAG